MIVRNARNEVKNLGPRRTFEPSMMKAIVGYTDTPGGWTGSAHHKIFAAREGHVQRTANPPQHTFTCEGCDTLTTKYYTAKYCSDRCRNIAAKRRERLRASQDRVVRLHPLEETR